MPFQLSKTVQDLLKSSPRTLADSTMFQDQNQNSRAFQACTIENVLRKRFHQHLQSYFILKNLVPKKLNMDEIIPLWLLQNGNEL